MPSKVIFYFLISFTSKGICLTPFSLGVISQLALAYLRYFQSMSAPSHSFSFVSIAIHWLIAWSATAQTVSPPNISCWFRHKEQDRNVQGQKVGGSISHSVTSPLWNQSHPKAAMGKKTKYMLVVSSSCDLASLSFCGCYNVTLNDDELSAFFIAISVNWSAMNKTWIRKKQYLLGICASFCHEHWENTTPGIMEKCCTVCQGYTCTEVPIFSINMIRKCIVSSLDNTNTSSYKTQEAKNFA